MTEADWKLAAPPGTPEDELCRCAPVQPWKLMPALGFNPVHCIQCNLEVPPVRMDLDAALVEELAGWNRVYRSFEDLWLDSGEYEQLAAQELGDLGSSVNQRGLKICGRLSGVSTCFYWLWRDQDTTEVPNACLLCSGQLLSRWTSVIPQKVCETCYLVTA